MVTELGTLVVIALILGIVGRALFGTIGASVPGMGRRRGGGSGGAWGIFFADLMVRLGTTVMVTLARVAGRAFVGAVRLGRGRAERAAVRPVRRSVDLSRRPEWPAEPRSPGRRGDEPVDDDSEFWEDPDDEG